MKKEQIDQLYHLLRLASNMGSEQPSNSVTGYEKGARLKTTLTPSERVAVVYGLCRHLLGGGDYSALNKFLMMYGESFLLEPASAAVKKYAEEHDWEIDRIVEFGAGLGWFGRGLAASMGMLPVLSIDKRPWPLIDLVLDLEYDDDKAEVSRHQLRKGDLIVASEFLHCLEDPYEVMADFSKWPTVILEYLPEDDDFKSSYSKQLLRYGGNPFTKLDDLINVFIGRQVKVVDLSPYVLLLVEPEIRRRNA